MLRSLCLLGLCASLLPAQTTWTYDGFTYKITSTAVGVFLTSSQIGDGKNHWLYEPSVIAPAASTNNQWVMLFSTNLDETFPTPEAIFMVTSANGTTPNSTPLKILQNTPSNICDMTDARPIWDGTNWHVFTQVAPYLSKTTCATSGPNFIAEAKGPSLTQLAWVLNAGTNNATEIICGYSCINNVGTPGYVGEGQQWFNTGPYGGYGPTPFMVLFNDWDYTSGGSYNNATIFSWLTDTFLTYNYYYMQEPAYTGPTQSMYPDVIMQLSAGGAGSPPANFGLGAGASCTSGQNYFYMTDVAFYPNIFPYPQGTNLIPFQGTTIPYAIKSVSSDSNGQRGWNPRFARDQYGYIVQTPGANPTSWTTYVYYDDGEQPGCDVNQTTGFDRFSVSQVTITVTP